MEDWRERRVGASSVDGGRWGRTIRDVGSEGENERRSDRPRTSTNY